MTYPPAPWRLKGCAVHALRLVDRTLARPFVPLDLDIVSLLPGKTLGGLFLSFYEQGSIQSCNELIVVPALTRHGRTLGFWISHIYVDHPDSLAGGRAIWGLPKEMAQFTWQMGNHSHVLVRQDEQMLCTLHYGPQRHMWRQPFSLPVFSILAGDLIFYKGAFSARLGLGKGRVDLSPESPFAALGHAHSARILHYHDMTFVAHAPRIIRHATA